MPKLKSLEDLRRLREQAQQELTIRQSTGTTITVGMGTCGIAAGARDTMQAILKEMDKTWDRCTRVHSGLHWDVLQRAAGRH